MQCKEQLTSVRDSEASRKSAWFFLDFWKLAELNSRGVWIAKFAQEPQWAISWLVSRSDLLLSQNRVLEITKGLQVDTRNIFLAKQLSATNCGWDSCKEVMPRCIGNQSSEHGLVWKCLCNTDYLSAASASKSQETRFSQNSRCPWSANCLKKTRLADQSILRLRA